MNTLNITSAQYLKDALSGANGSIQANIDDCKIFVPLDLENRHYAEIMRQVEAGTLVVAPA
jgi:hypothetical protein